MENKDFNLLLIYFLLFSFFSCQKSRYESNLTNALVECIESGAFPEKIISVFKSTYDYGEYDLYTIQGFADTFRPELYPYKIEEIENKYIFFFSSKAKGLDSEYVDQIVEENFDRDYDAGIYSNTLFFFLQCKDGKKKLLYHAINDDMNPSEIPEVRNFSCSDTSIIKNDIEIITEEFFLNGLDDYALDNKIITFFPERYSGLLRIYNRTDSCLFFDASDNKLGYFALLNGKDTLFLNAEVINLNNMLIDDLTYKNDPERYARIELESEENISFFSKISPQNYQEGLLSLIRDSLYYFPDPIYYNSQSNGCIYPQKKIQVITPPEGLYTFITPKYFYKYGSGRFFLQKENMN